MRMYLIAIIVALIGLWVSSEVRADGRCGLRSERVFTVETWKATQTKDGIEYRVTLRSRDAKAIRSVGGSVEFFIGETSMSRFAIALKRDVAAGGAEELEASQSLDKGNVRLMRASADDVAVFACVDSIGYVDGSGVIIN